MANDKEATVEVPVSLLQDLQARLNALEARELAQADAQSRPTLLIDKAFEKRAEEVARPPKVRTQEVANRKYGKKQPRFQAVLDSTKPDGKPGVNTAEFFDLEISAHSEHEARALYMDLMGITQTEHRIKVSPVAA